MWRRRKTSWLPDVYIHVSMMMMCPFTETSINIYTTVIQSPYRDALATTANVHYHPISQQANCSFLQWRITACCLLTSNADTWSSSPSGDTATRGTHWSFVDNQCRRNRAQSNASGIVRLFVWGWTSNFCAAGCILQGSRKVSNEQVAYCVVHLFASSGIPSGARWTVTAGCADIVLLKVLNPRLPSTWLSLPVKRFIEVWQLMHTSSSSIYKRKLGNWWRSTRWRIPRAIRQPINSEVLLRWEKSATMTLKLGVVQIPIDQLWERVGRKQIGICCQSDQQIWKSDLWAFRNERGLIHLTITEH